MLPKISSLNQLLKTLHSSTKDEYKAIGASLDIPLDEFEPYLHWSDNHYTRNCIIRTEDYELIVLCWEPYQNTQVHCHGGEECWVYLLEGKLKESHFNYDDDILKDDDSHIMESGGKSFMSDQMGYHSLDNFSSKRAISLHLYMDPIDSCTVYCSKTKDFLPKSLTYFSYEGIREKAVI